MIDHVDTYRSLCSKFSAVEELLRSREYHLAKFILPNAEDLTLELFEKVNSTVFAKGFDSKKIIISPLIRNQLLFFAETYAPHTLSPPLDGDQMFWFYGMEAYVTNKIRPGVMYFIGHKCSKDSEQCLISISLKDKSTLVCKKEIGLSFFMSFKRFERYDVARGNHD